MEQAQYGSAVPGRARVAAVTVNYFKAQRLVEGIRSLRAQQLGGDVALAVLDNSCDPGERRTLEAAQHLYRFRTVFAERNLGYPAGCNRAFATLPWSDYVLLLSPDIIWEQAGALFKLVQLLDQTPSIGMVGPRQINDDGSPQEVARAFPTLAEQIRRRAFPRPHTSAEAPTSTREPPTLDTDWLQSSCVLMRRSIWDRAGGLNERYFLFMSDIELGVACWTQGYRVCLSTRVCVRADGLRASRGGLGAVLTSGTQRAHLSDAFKFYRKFGFRRLGRFRLAFRALPPASRRVKVLDNVIR